GGRSRPGSADPAGGGRGKGRGGGGATLLRLPHRGGELARRDRQAARRVDRSHTMPAVWLRITRKIVSPRELATPKPAADREAFARRRQHLVVEVGGEELGE